MTRLVTGAFWLAATLLIGLAPQLSAQTAGKIYVVDEAFRLQREPFIRTRDSLLLTNGDLIFGITQPSNNITTLYRYTTNTISVFHEHPYRDYQFMSLMGNGDILISGQRLTNENSTNIMSHLTRARPDGSLVEPLNVPSAETIKELRITSGFSIHTAAEVEGGYTLGARVHFGSGSQQHLFRIDREGALVFPSHPRFAFEQSHTVHKIIPLPDSSVLVVGSITTFSNAPTPIIKLDPEGFLVRTFVPEISRLTNNAGAAEITHAEVDAEGRIYITGGFDVVSGLFRQGLTRLNANGTLDQTFTNQSGLNARSFKILSDGSIVVFGAGQFARRMMNGVVDTLFGADLIPRFMPLSSVDSVTEMPDGSLILSGFAVVRELPMGGFVRLNPTTADQLLSFHPPSFGMEEGLDAIITLARRGNTEESATVNLVADLPAGPTRKLQILTPTVEFQPGQTNVLTMFRSVQDSKRETNTHGTIRAVPQNPNIYGAKASVAIFEDDQGFRFATNSITVPEAATNAFLVVLPPGRGTNIFEVSYRFRGESATLGTDFIGVDGSISVVGTNASLLRIPIVNDSLSESNEQFEVDLFAAENGSSLAELHTTAVVRILDNDTGYSILTAPSVSESIGTLIFQVVRGGDVEIASAVDVVGVDGTARAELDYRLERQRVEFAVGQRAANVRAEIVDEGRIEPSESFTILLTNASPELVIAPPGLAHVTIENDDFGFRFASNVVTVPESATNAVLVVLPPSGGLAFHRVSFRVRGITAEIGKDFPDISGTFNVTATNVNLLTIPILNDSLSEDQEEFEVELFSPQDGAALGFPHTVRVRILDNDTGYTLAGPSVVSETNGPAALNISRLGDVDVAASVEVYATDGTATAGSDYSLLPQRVDFASGQRTAEVRLEILNDGLSESEETLTIGLKNPSPEVRISSPNSLSVRIFDNDFGYRIANAVVEESTNAAITIERGGDFDFETRLTMRVSELAATNTLNKATARSDFAEDAIEVVFAHGEASKRVNLGLVDDAATERTEFVLVTIEKQPGDAIALARAEALVEIRDDDVAESLLFVARDFPLTTQFDGVNANDVVELNDGSVVVLVEGGNWLAKYDVNGKRDTSFNPVLGSAQHVRKMMSGNLLVAVTDGNGSRVIQVRPNGSIVQGFTIQAGNHGGFRHVAEGADGSIFVAHQRSQDPTQTSIRRFLSTGAVDSAFKEVILSTGWMQTTLLGLADGKLLVGINGVLNGSDAVGVLAQYLPDGSLDPNFNRDGKATWKMVRDIVHAPSGGVYVAGNWETNGVWAGGIVQLSREGAFERTIGPGWNFGRICVLRDGSIIASVNGVVHRYLPDGRRDTSTFFLQTDDSNEQLTSYVHAVRELQDGSILLGGSMMWNVPNAPRAPFLSGFLEPYDTLLRFNRRQDARDEANAKWNLEVTRLGSLSNTLEVIPGWTSPYGASATNAILSTNLLRFDRGQAKAEIAVELPDDVVWQPNPKYLDLGFSPQDGIYARPITLLAYNDDVGFSIPNTMWVQENATNLIVRVNRPTPARISCSVDYKTAQITGGAVAGVDYLDVTGTLFFGPNDAYKEIAVPILNDRQSEQNENFNLTLSNPTGGPSLGPSQGTVIIQDNERGYFIHGQGVLENAGTVKVTIQREGDYDFPSTVTILPDASTSTARVDDHFTVSTNQVHFAAGQRTAWLDVAIVNNRLSDGHRYVVFRLSNPTQNIPIANVAGTLGIDDNERGYRFGHPTWIEMRVPEGETIRVNVLREGDYDFESTVEVSAVTPEGEQGAAVPLIDFIAVQTNLTFAGGETNKSFELQLPRDYAQDGNKRFWLQLASQDLPVAEPLNIVVIDDDLWPAQIGRFQTTGQAAGPVLGLPGRRVLVRFERGVRLLNAEGQPLWTWQPPGEYGVENAAVDSKGRFLLALRVGEADRKILRLNADGTPDSSFAAAVDAPNWPMARLVPLDDGGVVVGTGRRIFRYSENGTLDETFKSPLIQPSTEMAFEEVLSAGPGRGFYVRSAQLPMWFRITESGAGDPSFTWPEGEFQPYRAAVDLEGRLLVSWSDPHTGEHRLSRLTLEGKIDPTFVHDETYPHGLVGLLVGVDGAIYHAVHLPDSLRQIRRLLPTGERDPGFDPVTISITGGWWDQFVELAIWPGEPGRLLAWGYFQTMNGQPRRNMAEIILPPLAAPAFIHPRSASVFETNGIVMLRLSRQNTNAPLTMKYRTAEIADGAQSGVHYTHSDGTATFAAGDYEVWIPIELRRDARVAGDGAMSIIFTNEAGEEWEPARLTLRNVDPGILATLSPEGYFRMSLTGKLPVGPQYLERSNDLFEWYIEYELTEGNWIDLDPAESKLFYRLAPPPQ